jgi:hypothetical protein
LPAWRFVGYPTFDCRSRPFGLTSSNGDSLPFWEDNQVDQTIARLNIEHFRRLLKTETDPAKRATITRLLADEEAKLRSINAEKDRKKQG